MPVSKTSFNPSLTHLIDKELYVERFSIYYNVDYPVCSHLFEWSQYHDETLPSIEFSIGKAASTLAKAGYRPCHVK